ncbi:MAG: leucyl/phenylalanyl-tRNA--protein transferase [Gammaproteobacteria bacterium]|nr:leucyl/phenylalanyl-tRNA--protein transferase [Gammaproteobacteria bacterium]
MAPLTLLNDSDLSFPDPKHALLEPNGLLAIGGDLSTNRLINAYQQGIFPWYNDDSPIMWWSPDPRCVIFTHKFHVSKSFRRFLAKKSYHVTLNKCFKDVVIGCQQPRTYQKETWINDDIVAAYERLHHQGSAHSVEVWSGDQLVGGVYGVMTDNVFCGESMFSRHSNASKVALYYLSQFLAQHGIEIIDCQIPNDHLASLGAVTLNRNQFLKLLLVKPSGKLELIDWSIKLMSNDV